MTTCRILITALLGVPLWNTAPAQTAAALRVRVSDTSRIALPFANVATGDKRRFVTNDSGTTFVPSEVGATLELTVYRLGFGPTKVTVTLAGDSAIDVQMVPVPVRLAERVVLAKRYDGLVRAGFYDRLDQRQRGAGSGTFLTPEDLAARNAIRVSHVLDRAPGVRLSYTPGGHMIPRSAVGNCNMEIYLDGARLVTEATRPGQGVTTPSLQARPDARGRTVRLEYLDEIVQASSVAGIEIYTHGASVPQQFQSMNGTCGVIAIWTKSG